MHHKPLKHPGRPAAVRGVTLLELMVVVAIVAIIAAIAIPSYRSYVIRTQRTDATAALLRIAAAQEKFYLQNNSYATDDELAEAPPDGLGIGETEHGFYTLSIVAPNPVQGFTAVATVIDGGPQDADTACRRFSVTQTGAREAINAGNAVNTETCWR